jgi:hypothetical protein
MAVFCNFALEFLPWMSYKYFRNDFVRLSVAPTVVISLSLSHFACLSQYNICILTVYKLYLQVIFLSVGVETPVSKSIPFLSRNMSDLLHDMLIIVVYVVIVVNAWCPDERYPK